MKRIKLLLLLILCIPASAQTQLGADIDGEAAGDFSGWSVSLSSDGSTVAIGALNNDGNGNVAGHVRIYEYSSGSWTQLGADIDGEASDDRSGTVVSLSSDGTRVAIGAPFNDGNGNAAGHVRVYLFVLIPFNNNHNQIHSILFLVMRISLLFILTPLLRINGKKIRVVGGLI